MSDENFGAKLDRLIEEVDASAIAAGRDLSWLEILLEVYSRLFGEAFPSFEFDLADKVKEKVIFECLDQQTQASKLSEIEFLQMQYQAKFGESLTYNFMSIHTEEQLLAALRECLNSGKPYELPAETRRLMKQGAIF